MKFPFVLVLLLNTTTFSFLKIAARANVVHEIDSEDANEDADYYYDEDALEDDANAVIDKDISLSIEIEKKPEPKVETPMSIKERNRILREDMEKVEKTIRDPVAKFKALRELAEKHREAIADMGKSSKDDSQLRSSQLERLKAAQAKRVKDIRGKMEAEKAAKKLEENDDEYYEEEEEEKEAVPIVEDPPPQRETLRVDEMFLQRISRSHSCLLRRDNDIPVIPSQMKNNSLDNPSSLPRAAARAARRKEQLRKLHQHKGATADSHIGGNPQLNNLLMEKMKELKEKAKRIEASVHNPKKRAEMIQALAHEMEQFERAQKNRQREQAVNNTNSQNSTAFRNDSTSSQSNSSISQTATIKGGVSGKGVSQSRFLQEQQQLRAQKAKQRQEKQENMLSFRQGADCEALLCGGCGVMVEQAMRLGSLASVGVGASSAVAVEEAERQWFREGVCESRLVASRHIPLVTEICTNLTRSAEWDIFLSALSPFLMLTQSAVVVSDRWLAAEQLLTAKQKACGSVRFCDPDATVSGVNISQQAVQAGQEHWDKKCLLCQFFARDIETRVHLSHQLTEDSVRPIVLASCDRLGIHNDKELQELCLELTQGNLLINVAWLAWLLRDKITRQVRVEKRFPDQLCEEIGYCHHWEGEEAHQRQEALDSMDAVFF
mmetsp:Transcript_24907/g.35771  ORF Transcript_24907/g.35771 Transcript_24907/m.35771 type:complete len:663 (+) Transcript_24907:40-2028(+)